MVSRRARLFLSASPRHRVTVQARVSRRQTGFFARDLNRARAPAPRVRFSPRGGSHLLVPARGVQVRRGAQLGELELHGHRRGVEVRAGQRERLHAQAVAGAHAEQLALHAVQRDGAALHVRVRSREEHEVAQLGVWHERGVRLVDERRVRQRQILARTVRHAKHRHGARRRARDYCAQMRSGSPV